MESNPRELRRGIVSLELGSLRTPAVSNELYQPDGSRLLKVLPGVVRPLGPDASP